MKMGIFSLRRLRWKLALSYTLVAVVTLLAVELFIASGLTAFLSSELLPRSIVTIARDNFAPRLEPHLDGKTPDVRGLREELDLISQTTPEPPGPAGSRLENGTSDVGAGIDRGVVFVVDEDGKLLVSDPTIPAFPEGERFDAGRVEGLEPILNAALRGEESSDALSDRRPSGRLLMAVPVEGDDGRVNGVLVGAFRMPSVAGALLITVGAGAVLLLIPAGLLGLIFGFFTAWGITRRIGRLAHAARAWSRGDFSVTAKDRSKDELGQLSRELNQMAADLENLLQARGELATLEARNRFARDLHDSVKQQVFATSLQIAAARALIRKDTESAESHLGQADDLVRQAQKELNILIAEMRPAALEGKGLTGALRDYATRWSEGAEIPAEFRVRGEREAPLEVEQALFRVAQESLANVARHSGAGRAEVDLSYTARELTLLVSDNGRGFDPSQGSGGGFGLQSMRERLVKLGGRITVDSAPGKGTRVTAVCPFEDPSKKERRS
ncbi:HAMP domain-containing protein [Rubrobacter tropicus]|uniref:Oxygen sensor histidine kinase NreB n=1 Tax=Rubrobacter tropicus TaxID=2653851 RepID=A0A6G8QBL8_9ACTN|nr:ATP-binding protein [Rubrobacter tropicus]QIN83885.1 HAMP domain-containing protein [Rubrobacter tropicus]